MSVIIKTPTGQIKLYCKGAVSTCTPYRTILFLLTICNLIHTFYLGIFDTINSHFVLTGIFTDIGYCYLREIEQ